MDKITINPTTFRALFPAFKDFNDETIGLLACGVDAYISTTPGAIGLKIDLQTRGVYLACAHIAYMSANPDKFRQMSSASEGSVSASFATPPTKDIRDYWLSLSPYGLELLAILQTVQPPVPRKSMAPYPYYGTTNG